MILKVAMWRNSKKPYSKCLMPSCLSSSTFLVVLILLVPLFMVLIVFSCISWSWRFGSVSSTSFSSQLELFSSTSQNAPPYKYFEAQAAEAPLLFPNVSIPNETAQPPQLGPHSSSYVPHLCSKSIRVLCNANTSKGFNPSKDVSFPEIHLRTGEIKGLIGGLSPSRRSILAFFTGHLHGHIRHLLLKQWKEKDQDVRVYDQLPNEVCLTN